MKLGRISYDASSIPVRQRKRDQECIESTISLMNPRSTLCNACYLIMKRMRKAAKDGEVYRTSFPLHQWTEHVDKKCNACNMVEGRKLDGRPMKSKPSIQGCPKYLLIIFDWLLHGPRYRSMLYPLIYPLIDSSINPHALMNWCASPAMLQSRRKQF